MDIEKLGWLKASEYRKNILIAINGKRLTPKEIAGETEYYLSHVSNTLSDLEDKNLAECLTPSRNKGRIYVLTDEGQDMLRELQS
jgi:DNA-binding MarR family transcriptional regulator